MSNKTWHTIPKEFLPVGRIRAVHVSLDDLHILLLRLATLLGLVRGHLNNKSRDCQGIKGIRQ